MTAKHFKWFAAWIAQYPNISHHHDAVEDLCSYFEAINPKFDRDKFFAEVEKLS